MPSCRASINCRRWNGSSNGQPSKIETHNVRQNIDESTLVPTGTTPWVFNLYTDPNEQRSSGHRYFEWRLPRVLGLIKAHAATYAKYPMKNLGLDVPRGNPD